jgi:hypothetical protein
MVESIGHADSLRIEFFDKVCFRDEQSLLRSGRRDIFVLILSEKTKKIDFVKVDLMLGEVHLFEADWGKKRRILVYNLVCSSYY